MSSGGRLDEPAGGPTWMGLTKGAWIQIGIITAAFAALFWPNLWRLWDKTNLIYGVAKDNWSHSTLVPVIGLYYLYLNRDALLSAKVTPLLAGRISDNPMRWIGGATFVAIGLAGYFGLSFFGDSLIGTVMSRYGMAGFALIGVIGFMALCLDWGLGTLVCGILLFAYGIYPGRNDYVKDVGMVMTLFGVVLTLAGWGVMRIAWFPIVFLIAALPWPELVYQQVAVPLQQLAAKVAFIVLNLAQIDTALEGNTIVMYQGQTVHRLEVAVACAGLRSLMTFITAGAAIGFVLGKRAMWQRITIVASAIPIAILCNTLRVSVQGLLDFYVSQELSKGFAHMFVGLVMLIPAFFMLLGVSWALDHVFIEVEDDEEQGDTGSSGKGKKNNQSHRTSRPDSGPAAGDLVGGAA